MKNMYQVFISSTYQDIKEERSEAIQTILERGLVPTGMEYFGQDRRLPWEVIRQWLDACDIVLLIIKNEYGTVCKDNKSYTQMEYEYAVEQNKPIIKIVFEESESISEELKCFRKLVMDGETVTPVKSIAGMVRRIDDMLCKYCVELDKTFPNQYGTYYVQRYELIQYLMFAEDTNDVTFNRFMVAPKIMILLDMKKNYNPIKINTLEIRHKMIANPKYPDDIYDGELSWKMTIIKNISPEELDTYRFYAATDIGIAHDGVVALRNCADEKELVLSSTPHRNNGISCWEWEIQPSLKSKDFINDMKIREKVDKVWNFRRNSDSDKRNPEIVYFIPRNFGEDIEHVDFVIETEVPYAQFDMRLVEVVSKSKGGFTRKVLGTLTPQSSKKTNSIMYSCRLNTEEINMDSFYYIYIRKLQ